MGGIGRPAVEGMEERVKESELPAKEMRERHSAISSSGTIARAGRGNYTDSRKNRAFLGSRKSKKGTGGSACDALTVRSPEVPREP